MSYKTIYNDIRESRYKYRYGRLEFYFSSEYYLEKFRTNLNKIIKIETDKLKIKFDCNIIADEMIALSYYKNLEKRGYRVDIINSDTGEKCELEKTYIIELNIWDKTYWDLPF